MIKRISQLQRNKLKKKKEIQNKFVKLINALIKKGIITLEDLE